MNWQAIIFNGLIFLSIALFSFSAFAQNETEAKNDIQKIEYDVYAGGVHALEVNLTNDFTAKDKYNVNMNAKTYGLLSKLAPWRGQFSTTGWKGDVYKPQEHKSVTTFKDETDSKTYSYNKDGSFKNFVLIENGKDKKAKPSKELTQGTTDILTSTLNTMRVMGLEGKGCNGESEIFDGKRRFKLSFNQVRETILSKSGYNAYQGPAIECTALVTPVAGKWHEKPRGWASIQEQGRAKGSLPTVWFAVIEEGQPAVPVKMRVKTDYGTLFMHLTKYNSAAKSLKL